MLTSYFQNMGVGMTKDSYFEMCEALGNEPVESEIPIETDDFPTEVQEAITIYFKLRDDWDTMNGVYMGKSYTGLSDILDIYEVEHHERKYFLDWFVTMDSARSKAIELSKPKKEK